MAYVLYLLLLRTWTPRMFLTLLLCAQWVSAVIPGPSIDPVSANLTGEKLKLQWSKIDNEWNLIGLDLLQSPFQKVSIPTPESSYGLLSDFNASAPDTSSVKMATAGTYTEFQTQNVSIVGNGLQFAVEDDSGSYTALWTIDSSYGFEAIAINLTWIPKVNGWYSLLSPTIVTVDDTHMASGVIPGYWSSSTIQEEDEELTQHWNIGVPITPMITVEASTTSLVSIIEDSSNGLTFAVVADPSLARDPWESTESTQSVWQVGMSLRNLNGSLSPTGVYPILGQTRSNLIAGDTVTARFLFLISEDGWFETSKQVTQEIYPLQNLIERHENLDSLSHRMERVRNFLVTPASEWHLWEYDGLILGAESSKLSDVGAMWMIDAVSGDPIIHNQRLPYARNFKLAQQAINGTFEGAALGEYFVEGDGFVCELVYADISTVDYISPIFTTFYTLSDIGNILLFTPNDTELVSRMELAGDRLLSWQYENGSFAIGYIKSDPNVQMYPQLTDYRATWYGFIPAYKVLGQSKYLEAAERGASWYIENALRTGNFIGVCDDTDIVRDFHVIFGAQALLDLFDLTSNNTYLEAAIQVAQFYTLNIINHPVVNDDIKYRQGQELQDWQLSQVAMNIEHAGYYGSVNSNGPITLASHAGAFVRFYELSGDQIFLDLARTAAKGRDAWVDITSGISAYYWVSGNSSGSTYPWHGWWHIGWITDYLLSEAHLRSEGSIVFPQGFSTAKVGSHRPYGFEYGTIWGQTARLWMPVTLLNVSQPEVDFVTAVSKNNDQLFVILLNEGLGNTNVNLDLDPRSIFSGQLAGFTNWRTLQGDATKLGDNTWSASVDGLGITVLVIDMELKVDPEGPEFRDFDITSSGNLTINWEFWANATSWAEWRSSNASNWNLTPSQFGYVFSTVIDLSAMDLSVVDVRIATDILGDTGYSEPVVYQLS
jgi:hypothetical protein